MTDDAWANFIASLDPVALEQERMRVHGNLDAERPGSRQDHEMRFAHDYCREERAARAALTEAERAERVLARQEADVDRQVARHPMRETSTEHDDIEAAIRAYSQRHAARAAERNAA